MRRSTNRLMVMAVLVAMIPTAAAAQWSADVGAAIQDGERPRTVRMRFEVSNQSADRVVGGAFETRVPLAEDANSRLVKVECNVDARLKQRGVERSIHIQLPAIPPHGTVMMSVTSHLAVRTAPRPMKQRRGDWGLRAERLIEAEHPLIVKQAKALTRKTVEETAKAIYTWITLNVTNSGYTPDDRGALAALTALTGDCSEMAYLFVALARAAAIPARYMGGYVADSSALLTPQGYHNWAQWHDGKSWRVADPQKRIFDDRPERFIATNASGFDGPALVGGAHRFRTDTPGLTVRMLGGR